MSFTLFDPIQMFFNQWRGSIPPESRYSTKVSTYASQILLSNTYAALRVLFAKKVGVYITLSFLGLREDVNLILGFYLQLKCEYLF